MSRARSVALADAPPPARARRGPSSARRALLALPPAAVAVAAIFAVPAVVSSEYHLNLAVDAATFGLMALAIGFLVRQTGLVSFGHAAYFGLAAYLVAVLVDRWEWPIIAVVPTAVAGTAAFSAVAAVVMVRLSGIAFAMLTLAVGQALYILATKTRSLTGGFDGLAFTPPSGPLGIGDLQLSSGATFWPIAWIALVLGVAITLLVVRSRFGLLLAAIRENEERARFCGYETHWPRVAAFALSGSLAGLGGALYALHHAFVSPDLLYWSISGEGLAMAIVGGPAYVLGGPLGAFLFIFGRSLVESVTDHWELVMGLALIAVVVLSPAGVAGLLARSSRLLARRRERHA